MIVEVDPRSPLPPYEQLRQQVARLITSGSLAPGTRLPPIRQLAADLGLAPGTVARAYRELETEGLVAASGRRGTRVSTPDQWRADVAPDEVGRRLHDAAERYATVARQLGTTADDALAAVRSALAVADGEPSDELVTPTK